MSVLLYSLLGFACGSIPFSPLLVRLFASRDVREYGDGNPGAANAFKAGGPALGVPALLLDYLKGALPVWLALHLGGITGWGLLPVLAAPVLGHAYSPWLGLRGGKAVAVTFGVWSGLTYWIAPTILGAALVVFYLIQRNDAWSSLAGFTVLFAYLILDGQPPPILAAAAVNLAVLVQRHWDDLADGPRFGLPRRRSSRSSGETP